MNSIKTWLKNQHYFYLQQLQNNPLGPPDNPEYKNPIEDIPESEITQLEKLYNNGNPFPQMLKELLFLAGGSCYVIDWGPTDTQEELQEWVRETLRDMDKVMTGPFYIFDSTAGTFLFIYSG